MLFNLPRKFNYLSDQLRIGIMRKNAKGVKSSSMMLQELEDI